MPTNLTTLIESLYGLACKSIPDRETELKYAIAAKNGDTHARDTLFNKVLPLLYKMAVKHPTFTGNVSELIDTAFLAMPRALELYDPKSGNKFTSYFMFHALNAMNKETYEDRLIHIPENYVKAGEIPVTTVSMGTNVDSNGKETEREFRDTSADTTELAYRNAASDFIKVTMDCLSPDEVHVVNTEYDIALGEKPSKKFTREQIDRIRKAAIKKMRERVFDGYVHLQDVV